MADTRRWWRSLPAALAGVLMLAACGEPPVPLEVPERAQGQVFLDAAGILDGDDAALRAAVADLQERGLDIVLVTFEGEDANLGAADRAGRKVLEAWAADLAVVTVAEPGDFASLDPDRARFFGLYAREVRAVPRALRERIVEQLVPPVAGDNRWTDAFTLAVEQLAEGLAPAAGSRG